VEIGGSTDTVVEIGVPSLGFGLNSWIEGGLTVMTGT
jgi:hypothetical protein